MLLFSAALVCCVNFALSGITTGPGVQRIIYVGDTARFLWSVTGPISKFSVYNQTLGYPSPLNSNANYMMDNQSGLVILIINKVQLSDAGNYSLSVTTVATTQTDSSALLFVYGTPSIFVNQTFGGSGQQPAKEGGAVELTCTSTSTSVPVAYRPRMYYQWYMPRVGYLQNISSGQATLANYGDPVPGYSIKNDGRTLVIASTQYRDTQGILCYGREQWSPNQYGSGFYFPLIYKPFIVSQSPASRKFNAIVGDSISLSFNFQAFPDVKSATNWSFINTAGHAQDLPVGSVSSNSYFPNSPYSPTSLTFTLTSEAYYGNYSITISNSIGATTENFQVLGPGPPDAPSGVIVDFVSHYLIAIGWNCMWFNGRQQTTFLQLRSMHNDSIIDSWNTTLFIDCYNSTSITRFQNGIQPESDYEVRIWSTNNLGSSDVVKLSVRTIKVFKFFVSPKTISFNGNQAIVNYSATGGKIATLVVGCCVEFTGLCDLTIYYNVNGTSGQLKIDIVQSGDVYVFDFTLFSGDPSRYLDYYLGVVKDVRVSRNRDAEEPDDEKPDDEKPDGEKHDDEKVKSLLIAVIVLGVILGVAVLALIGCLLAFLIPKRRQKTLPNNSQQPQEPRYS